MLGYAGLEEERERERARFGLDSSGNHQESHANTHTQKRWMKEVGRSWETPGIGCMSYAAAP